MGKASRRKGKDGELELAKLYDTFNIDYSREQDGREQPCDFRFRLGGRDFWNEHRRREQLRIIAWSEEIEAKTPEGSIPILTYRPNHQPLRVSMLLSDFLRFATNKEDNGMTTVRGDS